MGVSGLTVLFFLIIVSPVTFLIGIVTVLFAASLLLLAILPIIFIAIVTLRLLKKKD